MQVDGIKPLNTAASLPNGRTGGSNAVVICGSMGKPLNTAASLPNGGTGGSNAMAI